jgi:hypothetical protein
VKPLPSYIIHATRTIIQEVIFEVSGEDSTDARDIAEDILDEQDWQFAQTESEPTIEAVTLKKH